MEWTGYKTWYFENDSDAGYVTIHSGGETEIAIGNKNYRLSATDKDLPKGKKSSSIAILRKVGQVICWCTNDLGMTLWYEPSDARREKVYKKAFTRMGLEVSKDTATINIKRGPKWNGY
jgi:hypothetical protein